MRGRIEDTKDKVVAAKKARFTTSAEKKQQLIDKKIEHVLNLIEEANDCGKSTAYFQRTGYMDDEAILEIAKTFHVVQKEQESQMTNNTIITGWTIQW